jgi:proline iminopeptidase
MSDAGARQGRITRHGLFADIRGEDGSPALLFLHGGPGQGCYDFMAIQGGLLSRSVLLIGLDQRGVDRSAPLPPGATMTVADVVADCEEVRRELGIDRWAVLGHSYGGALALRYAAAHPGVITAAIFENPVWDVADSTRAALPRIADMLADRGKEAAARAARSAASAPAMPGERPWLAPRGAYLTALGALGADREQFFVPDPATRARLAELRQAHEAEGQEDGSAGEEGSMVHHLAIEADEGFGEPLLPLLPRLTAPALLITGGRDPVTSPAQRAAFRAASARNQLVQFPAAGHFVHADDPVHYATAVMNFVRLCTQDPGEPSPGAGAQQAPRS